MKRPLAALFASAALVEACEPSLPKAPRIEVEAGAPAVDAGVDAGPPAAWIRCVTPSTCSEVAGSPELIRRARERCAKAEQDVYDGRCSTTNTVGSCVLGEVGLTIFTYKSEDSSETKARAESAPSSCAANGGKYTATK